MKKLNKPIPTTGVVISGSKIGRTINYPTANIKVKQSFTPKPGVYLSLSKVNSKSYLGLAYYGPQYINKKNITNRLEVYLFDFNKDIYSKSIKIELTHYLRPPKKVKNINGLKALIKKDFLKLQDYLVLTNKKDQFIGVEEILKAHQNPPQLHRATSVLIFNSKKELLLQKRSNQKPLWPRYWSNTCCGNKRPELSMKQFAQQRLQFEMGLKVDLKYFYKFTYKARYNKKLSEHEIDYVYLGVTDKKPTLNPKEAKDFQYISIPDLKKDIKLNPKKYTPWLKLIMKKVTPSVILTS